QIRAFDGTDWSAASFAAWSPFTIALTLYHSPYMATAHAQVPRNATLDLRGVAYSEPYSGYSITKYQFLDSTSDPNSGHLVVGGVVQPAGTVIDLTPAQF